MNVFDSLYNNLRTALKSEYFKDSIPSENDENISSDLNLLLKKQNIESLVHVSLSVNDYRVLGLFAERMASLALIQNEPLRIKLGLLALLIYSISQDPRDVVLVLSLLYDAILRLELVPEAIFDEVEKVFGKTNLFKNFLSRPVEDRSIDAMGYDLLSENNGFLYKRNW